MATTFPTTVDSYLTKVNGVDTINASHINDLQDAMVAVETALGAGSVAATPNPTANAIIKRDSVGMAYINRYGAFVVNTANVSIANGAWTAVTFDSALSQFGSVWSSGAATKFYAPVTGLYIMNFCAAFATNATGLRALAFRINGSTYFRQNIIAPVSGSDTHMPSLTKIYTLAAGAYVECMAYQTSGGALDLVAYGGGNAPSMEMFAL
jgi:hypothetical protein